MNDVSIAAIMAIRCRRHDIKKQWRKNATMSIIRSYTLKRAVIKYGCHLDPSADCTILIPSRCRTLTCNALSTWVRK